MWNESCEFEIFNPYFALIRFVVQDEDMFGDSNFIGQATYPVRIYDICYHIYLFFYINNIYPYSF